MPPPWWPQGRQLGSCPTWLLHSQDSGCREWMQQTKLLFSPRAWGHLGWAQSPPEPHGMGLCPPPVMSSPGDGGLACPWCVVPPPSAQLGDPLGSLGVPGQGHGVGWVRCPRSDCSGARLHVSLHCGTHLDPAQHRATTAEPSLGQHRAGDTAGGLPFPREELSHPRNLPRVVGIGSCGG